MARIRSIKPEFPQSESMGRVSRDARLLFVMLWPICDDHGRTRAASRMLASLLFPYDDDAAGLIDGWLDELERESCITRYEANGSTFLFINNWLIHQKIDKPSKPQFPEPPECLARIREDSLLEGKGREGKGEEGNAADAATPVEPECKKTKAPSPKFSIPADFALSDRVIEWGAKNNFSRLPEHFEAFKLKAQSKAYKYSDWDAALMNAIREDWAKLNTPTGKTPPRRKRLGEGSSTNYGLPS